MTAIAHARRGGVPKSRPRLKKRKTARAELTVVMNDPQFYLVRKDADEVIARYELLGREIEQLYEELVSSEAGETRALTRVPLTILELCALNVAECASTE